MFCQFCGSKYQISKNKNSEYYYCPKCQHLLKKSSLTSAEEKARYDLHICDENYWLYMNEVVKLIKPFLKGKEILDFGCGKLKAIEEILKAEYELTSYDLYYYPHLETKKFDTIILIEVIEHIKDTKKLFNELKKMLNSHGRLVIMTNFLPSDYTNWWYLRDKTHINFYSLNFFNVLASIFNLKIIYTNNKNLIVLEKISD